MRRRNIRLTIAMMLLPMMVGAQALKGSYFLDNSLLRTRLNPAFTPRANYFNIPVLSNTGIGLYGTVGPADFLYPKNGELYTFLNSNVSVEEFSSNLVRRPSMELDFDTDILSFGFYTAKDSFWSVDVGVRADAKLGVSRDFLMFLKQGMGAEGKTYSLDGFNVYQTSSIYAAIGHSHDFSWLIKGLKVGAKVRMFFPINHIGMTLGNSQLTLNNDKWVVNAEATGVLASSFMELNPEVMNGSSTESLMEADAANIGVAGFGFAFDLGAEYKLSIGSVVDGLTFSLSALDLGSYFFGKDKVQRLESSGNVVYEGMKDLDLGSDMNMDETLDKLTDEFLSLANFQEVASPRYHTVGTGAKIFAGVEYPFLKDKMSAGLLYSAKFGYEKMYNELTLSYNVNPSDWFNFSLNWSFLNAWKTLGWMVEFTPKKGTNFFIGSDYTFFEVMPKAFLPVDKVWTNLRFGLSFMIGSKYRD